MNNALRLLATSVASSLVLLAAGCSSSDESSSEAAGHISRAETYSDQGQYRSAMLEVRNAVQKDPGNVEHVVILASIYNDIGAGEQSTELLEPWLEDHRQQVAIPLARGYILQNKHLSAREALDGFSPDSDAEKLQYQLLLAESKSLAGNNEEAIRELRELRKKDPANPDITAALARALLAENEPNAAINELTGWSDEHGNNARILYLTGLAHYRMGAVNESTEALTEATGSLPTSDIFLPIRRQILTLLSRSLTEQGRITEAQVYNKILADNTSSDTRERAEAAIEAINRGELDTARTTLEELLQQNPDNERVAMMLGALSLHQGRSDDAQSLLVENVDAETTPTALLRAATIAQIDTGKREEALNTLSRAIEARPKDTDLLAMHGLLALSLPGQKDAGVASLSKALELDRSRSRLRLALARHYMTEDNAEQALAQMRVAFTETPTDWSVTQYYLSLLLSTDRESEAGEVAESLINGFADNPRAVTLAAMTEHRLGDTESAQTRLEKQTSGEPENVLALIALSAIYQDQGQNDKAVDTLMRAARLQPANVGLLQAAGRIYARGRTPDEVATWLNEIAAGTDGLAANAHTLAAQIRLQQGRLTDTRQILDRVPEDAQTEQSRIVRGQLLVAEAEQAARQEDWPTARAKAAEAASLRPDSLAFALIPIRVSAAEGNHEEALAGLEELESSFGEQPSIDLTRARLITATEGEKAAFDYLLKRWEETKSLELMPTLNSLAKQHSPERVGELAQAWVSAAPSSTTAQLTLAEYQMSNGDVQAAIASYEAALEQRPDNAIAMNNLAWLLREEDQQRAISLASRANELAPDNAAILDTYGWILHLAGRNQEALTAMEKALALAPENAEIQQHLDSIKQANDQ
ncbi:tetratricopeptide repeat protein [Marinobacter lacisalsi]|uniref:Tetratricopeptide repeat protein n=1 Tax=Marinobacter lacisalsi TaxID=475979 RepID=A0ABV8QFE5_9GAMM